MLKIQRMHEQTIIDTVRKFIVDNFLFGVDDPEIDNDTSFLESGLVDSTGILELVAFIEEHFQITVEIEEMLPENLDSLSKIAGFLETKATS